MLWAYEGLTEYYGEVLGARSGLRSPELAREALALFAAKMDRQSGRAWRPLRPTPPRRASSSTTAGPSGPRGGAASTSTSEGALVWLDADVLIRGKSGGRKSLDDFVRGRSHGGPGGAPAVRDVHGGRRLRRAERGAALGLGAASSANGSTTSRPARRGRIESAGWKLTYTDAKPALVEALEEETESCDFWDCARRRRAGQRVGRPGRCSRTSFPACAAAQGGGRARG